MKKLLSLIATAVLFAVGLSAQPTVVTVGDETSTDIDYGPIKSYDRNSFSEVVYLSSELQPGIITSISYHYVAGDPLLDPAPAIYMAEVSRTSFANLSDWETATMTQVYAGGSVTYNYGWVTINLTTPFVYNGTGNLVVAYNSQRPNYSGYKYFTQTSTSDNRMLMYSSDDNAVPGYNCTYGGTLYSRIPNTRFTMLPLGTQICYAPSQVSASNIEAHQATISWTTTDASATTFAVDYRLQGSEVWTNASNNITDTFYTLTDLNSLTNYEYKVYTVCSESNSREIEGRFMTSYDQSDLRLIPFYQNFDQEGAASDFTFLQGTSNAWYVGTAENNTRDENDNLTQGGSLYISSDNGTTAGCDYSSTTNAYAYFYVNLQANTSYGLQFDWKAKGDSWYDYLRVYLLRADVELSSADLPYEGNLTGSLRDEDTWQSEGIVIDDTVSGVYKLVFAWHNDGSAGLNPAAVIDNVHLFELTCAPASSIDVEWTDEQTHASCVVSIESDNENVTYALEYKMQEQDAWIEVVGASPISINNLSYGTPYLFRVTPICNGTDYSITSDEVLSYSVCGVASAPYSESFEGGFVNTNDGVSNRNTPVCWFNINGGASSYYFSESSMDAHSGNICASYSGIYSSSSTENFSDWLISPVFDLTGNEQLSYQIRANWYQSSYPNPVIDVYACNVADEDITSAMDTSRFVLVRSINHNTFGNDYQEKVATLSAFTGPTRVAIVVRQATQSFRLDDIALSEIPSCPPVYGFNVVATSDNAVAVSYDPANITPEGVTIAYAVDVEETIFDPEAATTYLATQDEQMPIEISSLTPGTTYIFAAKQSCEGGTYCTPVIVTLPEAIVDLPYSQNFDNLSGHGFTFSGSTDNPWLVGTAQNNTTDDQGNTTTGGALYVSNDNGATASYNTNITATSYASSPFMAFGQYASYTLSFDYKAMGEATSYAIYDYLTVHLVPFGGTVTESNAITPRLANVSQWTTFTTTLPASYANGTYQLVFKWYNDSGAGVSPAGVIDNISVVALSCSAVNSVSAVPNETEDSANPLELIVYIDDDNLEETGVSYTLQYKTAEQENYTTVSDLSLSDFPYHISNAEFGSVYTLSVAAQCPDGVQTAAVSTTVTTPCAAETLPWTEIFSTDPLAAPACWEQRSGLLPANGTVQTSDLNASGNSAWIYNDSRAIDGATSGRMRINVYGASGRRHWLISPSIDLGSATETAATYRLAFDVALTRFGNTNPPAAAPDDKFAVLVSTDNGLTWDLANATIFADGDEDTEHNFSDLTNSMTTCFVRLANSENVPFTGTIKVAFYAESTVSNGDNDLFIDNIAIDEWEDCVVPYNVAVNNVRSSKADVTFTEMGSATSWEYVLIEGANADLSTGTPIQITEADLPLQLQNLGSLTTYTFAIRSLCGSAPSAWSNAVVFTTLQTPESIPFTTDFEDAESNSTWTINTRADNTNSWVIGSATFAGDEENGTSAYLSYNGGTTYAATNQGTRAISYMWKDFDFGEDPSEQFTLSFDWKMLGYANSGSLNTGLAVYILDPEPLNTTTLPAIANRVVALYGQTDWTHEIIDLTGYSGEKRVVFATWGYNNTEAELTSPAAIDNVSLTATVCFAPQNVIVGEETSSTVEVSWEGTSESYNIFYRPLNGTEISMETATSSPFVLTGLNSTTEYVVVVQGVCGSDESAYSDEVTFRTSCFDAPISDYPYTEGFENGLDCWIVSSTYEVLSWNTTTSGTHPVCAPHGGSNMAVYSSYNIPQGESSTMISPAFSFSQDMQLSFWMYKSSLYPNNNDRVLVYVNNVASETGATLLGTIALAGTDVWEEQVIALPTGLNGTHYLIFKAISDFGANIHIDDVTLSVIGGGEQPDPCDAPTALAVNNITQTSADFTWSGTATSYEVRLNGGNAETVTTTSKSFTNLTANTSYTAEVRAVCESNNSAWVSTTFTTLAEQGEVVAPTATTLPATEVTYNSATLNATITAGTEAITAQGFMYKATAAADWTTVAATGETMSATINGLTAETAYQYKAFATTASGTVEGAVVNFTTLQNPGAQPTVVTLDATEITNESATLNGTVVAGTNQITAQGFKYKTVFDADWTTVEVAGTNISATISNLTAETQYEYKAFATTESGTVEGNVILFTTTASSGLNTAEGTVATMTVYPNPASERAIVAVSGVENGAKIVVSDMQGRIILSDNMTSETYELSVANMTSGVYYIRVIGTTSTHTQKLIVE